MVCYKSGAQMLQRPVEKCRALSANTCCGPSRNRDTLEVGTGSQPAQRAHRRLFLDPVPCDTTRTGSPRIGRNWLLVIALPCLQERKVWTSVFPKATLPGYKIVFRNFDSFDDRIRDPAAANGGFLPTLNPKSITPRAINPQPALLPASLRKRGPGGYAQHRDAFISLRQQAIASTCISNIKGSMCGTSFVTILF